ncbi:hypothetical protein BDB00DRAFT_462642 [Zychaea mexicana]|uniref:uncharacterized protein n=1 Tax=Zychaea mexicana TaxID=64656 RepID=UPI0022FEEDC0|nr:uncharacterized protein BDB00DRAFT_462642 [Zychaea mexicana]KAI9491931.1 hypothetical protein BDB00DRAFT_462642 [Zychaea mexicana]
MDGMFSSLSTCKSSHPFAQDPLSPLPPSKSQQQHKGSILDYSRVIKSSLASSNPPSQEKDEKKNQVAVAKDTDDVKSFKVSQLHNNSRSLNSPKTPESGEKASQTSSSSHQCTLSEYYTKQKKVNSPPYTPQKQQQQQVQQRKLSFQHTGSLSQQSQKSSASSGPSNNLHQTTLSEYPHYTNKSDPSVSLDDDDNNNNNLGDSKNLVSSSSSSSQKCVVRRNPPMGLNRKHARTVPLTQGPSSSTSTSNSKRRRPTTNLADLCKASQTPRKRTFGLRAPRRRSPH